MRPIPLRALGSFGLAITIVACGSAFGVGQTVGPDASASEAGPGEAAPGADGASSADANGDARSGGDTGSTGAEAGDSAAAEGGDAGPAEAGEGGMDGAPDSGPVEAGPTANLVFATSTTYSGALGGLSGADAICAARASAAGLSGTFVAWLWTSTVTGVSRLGTTARGWVRTDGLPFADTAAELGKLAIFYPPDVDESGNPIAVGERAWTGYFSGSTVPTCSDWTDGTAADATGGTAGLVHYGTVGWTYTGTETCDVPGHLYCFQIDKTVPVTPPPPPAGSRIAFQSSAFFGTSSGLAGADGICASEASSASLTGTFKALLATSTATAISRFDTTGPAWYRPDGVQVVAQAADLPAGNLIAPITVSANKATNYNATISAGSSSPTALATGSDCVDWSSSLASNNNATGLAEATDSAFFGGSSGTTFNCAYGFTLLYCLQQ